ncbi:CRISPR-associated protein Cas4 [Haloarchaeobius sp. DYHT-AS-18]|uniref:CRISPR-associated protein Cas4 n=1 Tax=Haloarchaeobius sp. DYHT-AS-18 TaxID=3446117 RepID=UPI003EBEAD8F
MFAFSDLRLATYCPRKLYYTRQGDREPPDEVTEVRALAFRYPELLDASDAELRGLPIDLPPARYRDQLRRTREHTDRFDALCDPAERDAFLSGKACRGIAHKVLQGPPEPSLVSPGTPPKNGVWEPHAVWAVAAAKALAWEGEQPVARAFVEYPKVGVVRAVRMTGGRKAAFQRAKRTLEAIDGPPPRLRDSPKCESCEYASECGVKTRSLRSLLGL